MKTPKPLGVFIAVLGQVFSKKVKSFDQINERSNSRNDDSQNS
jgi:hypothetical protein